MGWIHTDKAIKTAKTLEYNESNPLVTIQIQREQKSMIEQQNLIYVGVDLHKQHHTAVIIDCWSKKLGELKFDNKPSAFPLLLKELKKYIKKGLSVVYGLEDVGGYGRGLAVYLKDNRCWVKEVNAKLANARRKSHVTVQKSDSWDAECVAKVLRDELERLPDAQPVDLFWAISQLVTQRKWLANSLTETVRKMHQQISYSYPSYKKFFSEVEGKTALAFWETYPSPYTLKDMSEEVLAAFLRKHSNNGLSHKKANQILTLIDADGETYRDFQDSRDTVVVSQVESARFFQEQLVSIEGKIEHLMQQLGFQLESMTGINVVTAAQLVAEIGDIHRFSSSDKLARFAGIAPVIVGSGNKFRNCKSKQGNRVLHEIIKSLAIRQIGVTRTKREPKNAYFHAYYERKIAEGKTKQQAIVCLMRKLVNIIYVMMKKKSAYVMPNTHVQQAG